MRWCCGDLLQKVIDISAPQRNLRCSMNGPLHLLCGYKFQTNLALLRLVCSFCFVLFCFSFVFFPVFCLFFVLFCFCFVLFCFVLFLFFVCLFVCCCSFFFDVDPKQQMRIQGWVSQRLLVASLIFLLQWYKLGPRKVRVALAFSTA